MAKTKVFEDAAAAHAAKIRFHRISYRNGEVSFVQGQVYDRGNWRRASWDDSGHCRIKGNRVESYDLNVS